jgi:hypothetical protein
MSPVGVGRMMRSDVEQSAAAGVADALRLVFTQLVVGAAEHAAVLNFGEHNAITVNRNLDEVALFDGEQAAQLSGQHNASELIDLAGDTD